MRDFELVRRFSWTREQIDAHDDEYIEELLHALAGWDEAVAEVQQRANRKAARAAAPAGRPVYGAPGMTV